MRWTIVSIIKKEARDRSQRRFVGGTFAETGVGGVDDDERSSVAFCEFVDNGFLWVSKFRRCIVERAVCQQGFGVGDDWKRKV